MDKGKVTALTLLDLSTAFDTIDHATLTDRLSHWYGISGQAQIWFSSYLQNRLQSVKIKETFSDKVTLSYGIPQGSVLGPVLFTLYTTPLSAIISSFDINHHLYADDTQIYMSISVSNAKESLEKLQHCKPEGLLLIYYTRVTSVSTSDTGIHPPPPRLPNNHHQGCVGLNGCVGLDDRI